MQLMHAKTLTNVRLHACENLRVSLLAGHGSLGQAHSDIHIYGYAGPSWATKLSGILIQSSKLTALRRFAELRDILLSPHIVNSTALELNSKSVCKM